MRIGVIADIDSVNAVYRAFPLGELSARGHQVTIEHQAARAMPRSRRPAAARFRGFDVVHIHRALDDVAQELVRELQALGVAVVWDNDDNLNAVPEASPIKNRRGGLLDQKTLRDARLMVRAADLVTTPSETLAELYRSWGGERVVVVGNFLPGSWGTVPARPHEGVVVGWVAGAEHRHDLEQLRIADALAALCERHAEVRIRSIGLDLGLTSERSVHVKHVPYRDLGQELAGFDIGIAPLDDIAFNRARSDVKLKEYAAAGVPWLASPIGPYATLGEKQGGRLVADGEWLDALDRLVTKSRDRRKLAKRALDWGARQGAARNAESWERALAEAVERARSRRGTAAAPAR